MKKRRTGVIAAAFVTALVAIVLPCVTRPSFVYYSIPGLRVLPARLMRQAFRLTTEHDPPETFEAAQGMISGGREVWAFFRFHTDKAGIQYVLHAFGGAGAETEMRDEEGLRHWSRFKYPQRWQKELGVSMFDQKSIRLATVIVRIPAPNSHGYVVLIDMERDDVYILGMEI